MVTENPGVYFRDLMPHYARAAKICELVYSNISKLYKPMHAAGEDTASFITLGGDADIIKCRCLLGYYKPTIGGSAEDVKQALIEFNQLLKDNAIHPNNFTGSELSDAEHFFASAVITMVPILGLVANPIANYAWDFLLPYYKSLYKNAIKTVNFEQSALNVPGNIVDDMRYDVNQLTGPDLAGHRYGISVTYINNTAWLFESAR